MGVVYAALDRELGSRVALKVLPSTSPEAFQRFKNEFRSLQNLNHENLVRFGDLVYERGQLFFTMELVEGADIISYCHHEELRTPGERDPLESAWDATLDSEHPALPAGRAPRRGPRPVGVDEDRVRSAFAQLVRGLMALHASGKVHRDVKPSNVLATPEGRIVLLDFGIVSSAVQSDGRLVGTVDYMAPEQAARQRVGPGGDLYAVGVMLFEAFTRRLPFDGGALEILGRKQREKAPRIRDIAPTAPAALDELCARLLDPNPEARPRGEDVLRALATSSDGVSPYPAPSRFLGRRRETSELERLFHAARSGRTSLVHIEGESGCGKTTLVEHFLERVSADPKNLVLRGRCSEREFVPFKAIDGVLDDLADFVRSGEVNVPRARIRRHLPALVRVFPVFARLGTEPGNDAPESAPSSDPFLQRLEVFRALRELVAAVCAERNVVVWLDDVHWADADSVALLSGLVRGPFAVPLFFVATGRPHPAARTLRRSWGGELIELGNLSPDESQALARHLLDQAESLDADRDDLTRQIALEADGHPLFIDELVQHVVRDGKTMTTPAALDAALWSRVQGLGNSARALVELVAIGGSALTLRVLAQAVARLTVGALGLGELFRLRNEHLVRFDGTGASSSVEPYHDRVAAAVRARLTQAEEQALHRAIAGALETDESKDAAELATHWLGAGELTTGARYALSAADAAAAALAFERAARLYQIALDSWPDMPDRRLVLERLGDALASAGLGAAASRAYLDASHEAEELGRYDLERRAADQLFRTGHIDEAEPLIARVLHRLGMTIPRSPFWSLLFLLLTRLRLFFMRFDGAKLGKRAPDPRALALLNACWSVSVGLSMVNNIRGACLQSRTLVLALRIGQPMPLLKAMAAEAGYVAVTGRRARKRVKRLLERTDELARTVGDSYAIGFSTLSKAICSFLMGEWAESRAFAHRAEEVFENRPSGAMWELASARTFGLWSSFYLGDLPAMRARTTELIHEAESRGDRYAATLHRTGVVVVIWLAADEPDVARRQVLEAETGWSRATFDFQRYLNTLAHSLIDLYEGAPELAHRRLREMWPSLSRSLYLRIQNVRIEAHYARGLCAVGSARRARGKERFLRDAERCARRLARERVEWATGLSHLLTGGIADLRGDRERAAASWKAAEAVFVQQDMALFAGAAALRAAQTLEPDAARRSVRRVRENLSDLGVADPERLCALLSPGLPLSGPAPSDRG